MHGYVRILFNIFILGFVGVLGYSNLGDIYFDNGGKAFAEEAVTKTTDVHFNGKYCSECHERTPVKGVNLFLKYNGDFKQLCRCHFDTSGTYLHPVEIQPSEDMKSNIPDVFPLFDGRITCSTCHDIVLQCQDSPRDQIFLEDQMFLRGPPVKIRTDFCYRCHDKTKYAKYNPHKQLDENKEIIVKDCLYCHTEKPDEETATYKEVKLIGELETLCVRCHGVERADRRTLHGRHLRKPSAEVLKRMKQLEQEFGIVLPLDSGGRISCATCHNPHEEGVIPDERPGAKGAKNEHRHRLATNLCIRCHQM